NIMKKQNQHPQHTTTRRGDRAPLTEDRRQLAENYLPFALTLARRFRESWPQWSEEFVSAAYLALVEAAEAYDPARSIKFATFARPRILGALRDVRRRSRPLGRPDGEDEAPSILRLGPSDGVMEPSGQFCGIAREDSARTMIEAVEEVEARLRTLPPRYAAACRQIYIHGRNVTEAAAQLGCTTSRLWTMHRKALEMLSQSWPGPHRPTLAAAG
ncbi:MAG: sigma-70 family RNA polymerase sigma factor, partial [Isosphaeraceae bacterium]|nr:sigma-70 family RNA polymerase sigma factor [Isosphaeraceae bacterium]